MTLIEWLDKLDKISFILIHHDSDYKFLDNVFLIIRNAATWVPLYCFMLYFALAKFKNKAWLFIVLTIVRLQYATGYPQVG